eukprot:11122455-Alexandrium_andersonii.AAC.1
MDALAITFPEPSAQKREDSEGLPEPIAVTGLGSPHSNQSPMNLLLHCGSRPPWIVHNPAGSFVHGLLGDLDTRADIAN